MSYKTAASGVSAKPLGANGTDADWHPAISVIIVNYNGRDFLAPCLESVHTALASYVHEIIVVDNASTDGSQFFLRTRNDIRLIESSKNTGFSGGNNIGVKAALGALIVLLNNDTRCLNSMGPLIECLGDPLTGVVGCALFYEGRRVQPSVGFEHTPLRVVLSWLGLGRLFPYSRFCNRLYIDPSFYSRGHRRVDWVSGACLVTRRALWLQLGGLDESFFMYCEDVDFCRRVRQAGHEVRYTADTAVLHYEAAGKQWVGKVALQRTARSYLIYVNKHYGRMAQAFTGLVLGPVFFARSLVYRVLSIGNPCNSSWLDKCLAYWQTGRYLMAKSLRNSNGLIDS